MSKFESFSINYLLKVRGLKSENHVSDNLADRMSTPVSRKAFRFVNYMADRSMTGLTNIVYSGIKRFRRRNQNFNRYYKHKRIDEGQKDFAGFPDTNYDDYFYN